MTLYKNGEINQTIFYEPIGVNYTEITNTFTIGDNISWVLYNPASTAATLDIEMPSVASLGQEIKVFFGGTITSGTVVTALSFIASMGTSVITDVTDAVIGDVLTIKRISNKWYISK
jgi:hypothetical protein